MTGRNMKSSKGESHAQNLFHLSVIELNMPEMTQKKRTRQCCYLPRCFLGMLVFLSYIHCSSQQAQMENRICLRWSAYINLLFTISLADISSATTVTLGDPNTEAVPFHGLPQFHSPQLRLTVKEGDRVRLPCKIFNLGDNHVIWRHKTNVLAGTNVSTFADHRITLDKDLTLEITGVTREDEGEYECAITGAYTRVGPSHSVTVHDAPTVSLITPTQLTAIEGENVEIGCIPHGKPTPRITWSMRDGHISIPKSQLHQPKITIQKVTRTHAGLYVCSADNGVGRPAIGAVYIRVLYTPEIESPKRRVHGGVGYKSQLVCVVHSDPPAEVTWRIGKKKVELSERIFTEINNNEHNLVLNPVKEYDFNTYTCEANNSRGYDIRHIEFTGVPNPPIISRWETQILVKGTVHGQGDSSSLQDTSFKEEIHVTLFWVVECYSPLIDYRLHFRPDKRNGLNGKKEKGTPWEELAIPADQSSASFIHTKAFTLRGLQPETIYEAAIKARNKYGWSQLSDICYFSTFPNSSSAKQQEFEGSIQRWKDSVRHEQGDAFLPEKDEFSGFLSNKGGMKFSFGWFLRTSLFLLIQFLLRS